MTDVKKIVNLEEFLEKKFEEQLAAEEEFVEHPDNIKCREERPKADEAFLERRARAIKMIYESFELREFIADIKEREWEWTKNYFWWVAKYLKSENLWKDEKALISDIEFDLFIATVCKYEELVTTPFDSLLYKISEGVKSIKKADNVEFKHLYNEFKHLYNLNWLHSEAKNLSWVAMPIQAKKEEL